jgi:hypothetical protein
MNELFASADGSTSATGSKDQPLALQAALNTLRGGERLTILPGRYVGAFVVPSTATGERGAETEIVALDGVVVDGEDRYPKGELDMSRGGIGYTDGYLYLVKASHIKHTGMIKIINSVGSGLRINAEQNVRFDGAYIQSIRWQPWRVDSGKAHTIRNVTALDGGLFNPTDRSAQVSNWPNCGAGKDTIDCVFEYLVFGRHYGEAFGISGDGNILRNFEVFNCMSAGVYLNRCGKTVIQNGLIRHDGLTHTRGGSASNGVVLGNEEADKQSHRPPTHDIDIGGVVTVGMGPGLSFRSQTGEGFTNVNIHDCTFYESREKGKKSSAVYFNTGIPYTGVRIENNLFVQTAGTLHNGKSAPVDLTKNTVIADAKLSPLPSAKLPYTGKLTDYIAPNVGAEDWTVPAVVEPDPVDPEPDSALAERVAVLEQSFATLRNDLAIMLSSHEQLANAYQALALKVDGVAGVREDWLTWRERVKAAVN